VVGGWAMIFMSSFCLLCAGVPFPCALQGSYVPFAIRVTNLKASASLQRLDKKVPVLVTRPHQLAWRRG
jgi:hypothetical protein